MKILALFLAVAVSGYAQTEQVGSPGFVGLTRLSGAWYFTSPEGEPFLSRGVDVVRPFDDAAKPGAPHYNGLSNSSKEEWANKTATRLLSWNFDTVANWSDAAMAGRGLYTVETLAARIRKDKQLVDVFSDGFAQDVKRQAAQICAPRTGDTELIGYFLENEQPWYGDFGWPTGHASTFLDRYMAMASDSPGKQAVVTYLKSAYDTIEAFNTTYSTTFTSWTDVANTKVLWARARIMDKDRNGFLAVAADEYYRVVSAAIREADPHHLVLGDRFANAAPREVIQACARWCDVVSLNYYAGFLQVSPEFLRGFADAGKPLLITEFSYRATENRSGDKNALGASVTVPTQKDRADHYRRYVSDLARLPFIVGWHWFQYFDESPQGRSFDGEDSDYGFIDIADKPYEDLVAAVTETNAAVLPLHAGSGQTVIGDAVYGDEPIKVRRAATSAPAVSFGGNSPKAYGWGDGPHGGTLAISVSGSVVTGRYATGSGWGCGLSVAPSTSSGYADLSHHDRLELVVSAPKGLRFSILLSEQGVGETWAAKFDGADGSDGESFSSEEFTATGVDQTIVVSFDELALRSGFGNQKGNKTLDLQAVHEIDLALPGNQGSGTVTVKSLRAVPAQRSGS